MTVKEAQRSEQQRANETSGRSEHRSGLLGDSDAKPGDGKRLFEQTKQYTCEMEKNGTLPSCLIGTGEARSTGYRQIAAESHQSAVLANHGNHTKNDEAIRTQANLDGMKLPEKFSSMNSEQEKQWLKNSDHAAKEVGLQNYRAAANCGRGTVEQLRSMGYVVKPGEDPGSAQDKQNVWTGARVAETVANQAGFTRVPVKDIPGGMSGLPDGSIVGRYHNESALQRRRFTMDRRFGEDPGDSDAKYNGHTPEPDGRYYRSSFAALPNGVADALVGRDKAEALRREQKESGAQLHPEMNNDSRDGKKSDSTPVDSKSNESGPGDSKSNESSIDSNREKTIPDESSKPNDTKSNDLKPSDKREPSSFEKNIDTLNNPAASAPDKIRAAQDLAVSGHKSFEGHDGKKYDIQTKKYGNRTGVVVSTSSHSGSFMPILRGIVDGHGRVSHQRDSHGREVKFGGDRMAKEDSNDAVLSHGAGD